MHILIIGAGLGGLTLANALQKPLNPSIHITILERHASPTHELAGYGLHLGRDGNCALQRCLTPEVYRTYLDRTYAAGAKWAFRGTDLNMLVERDDVEISGMSEEKVGRRGMHRGVLRGVLLEGLKVAIEKGYVDVKWGREFVGYSEEHSGKVRAIFADGSNELGDLLVGADGSKSRVREVRLPKLNREDLDILTIVGRYPLDDEKKKHLPAVMTDGSLNNIVPWGTGWLFLASFDDVVGGIEEKYTLWAYVLPSSMTPTEKEVKAMNAGQMRDVALEGVKGWGNGAIEKVIRDVDLTTVNPILLRSMPTLPPWSASHVTLLGDAIHNMTPMAGVGANTALKDAHVLADLLLEVQSGQMTLLEAVEMYEEQMRRYANKAVALSKEIAMGASSPSVIQRWIFHAVLWLAGQSHWLMKATIGRGGFVE